MESKDESVSTVRSRIKCPFLTNPADSTDPMKVSKFMTKFVIPSPSDYRIGMKDNFGM